MTVKLIKASGIRALRTAIQTTVAMCGTSALIQEVDWKALLSAVVLASILSFLTGILGGLPEVSE